MKITQTIKNILNFYKKVKYRRIQNLINSNTIRVETELFGNEYGGYNVFPLEKYKSEGVIVVMSFGIGEDLSFSEAIMKRFGPEIEIYAFDPTPKSIRYVGSHELSKESNFHFFSYGISDKNERTKFHLPKNPNYVSGSVEYHKEVQFEYIDVEMKSLCSICREHNITKINILKMDIEGSEYRVISDVLNSGIEFDQLCIETHRRFFKDGAKREYELFKNLITNGYKVISMSSSDEYTFIKQDLLV